jgi:adenosylcobinamide-GDP ribazoletransferase
VPDGLRLALTTFTVAPLRGPRQPDRRTARTAVELAPLVGLLLGLLAAGVLAGSRALTASPQLLPAALAVGSLALLTDGLADLADGLGSYRDPEGTRAVMKAPDVGPMGVVALVTTLLVQVAAVLTCTVHGRGAASLVLAVVTGRLAVLWACIATPAATTEGLGALVAQTARRPVAAAWTVVTTAAFAWYATVDGGAQPVLRTVLAVALALGLAALVRRHAARRVGGLTGDVLGALSELATTACLVVLAAAW